MTTNTKRTKRTVDVYSADREDYFPVVRLVLGICSGRDRRGQIVRKPEFLACVMIWQTLVNPANVTMPVLIGKFNHVQPDRDEEVTVLF